ncbi:MAG: iron-containing alcohol dehydrogenase, partial [Hyphomicrobiaceae bacterium]
MQLRGNWNYPTSVRFGAGRISELGEAAKSAGMSRPLLVTDPRLAAMPMVKDALTGLAAAGLQAVVFSDIKPNPVAANVEAGLRALKSSGNDGVIAFGG